MKTLSKMFNELSKPGKMCLMFRYEFSKPGKMSNV